MFPWRVPMMNKRLELDEARRKIRSAEEELASVRAELALEKRRREVLEHDARDTAAHTAAQLESAAKDLAAVKADLALERQRSGELERALQSMISSPAKAGPPLAAQTTSNLAKNLCTSGKVQAAGERISQAQLVSNDGSDDAICDKCKMQKKSSGNLTAPTSNNTLRTFGERFHNAPTPFIEDVVSNGPANAGPPLAQTSTFDPNPCLERRPRLDAPKDRTDVESDNMLPTSSDMDLTVPVSNAAQRGSARRLSSDMDLTAPISNTAQKFEASRNDSFGNLPSVINMKTNETANPFQRLLHTTATAWEGGPRDSLTLVHPALRGPEESSTGGGAKEKEDETGDAISCVSSMPAISTASLGTEEEDETDDAMRRPSVESISIGCLNRSSQDEMSLKGGALSDSGSNQMCRLNDMATQEIRLFYTSEVVGDLASKDIAQIIETSKRNNSRVGITGVLLWLESHFFQILEGDSGHVLSVVERIREDERHCNMRILHIDRGIDTRLFGEWNMKGVNYDMINEPALEIVLKPTKALLICLMSAHSIIEHYVDSNISRLISEGINPLTVKPCEKRRIIMFADVRSFTTLSERLPVNVVVSLVNAHFEISSKVIRAHGGEINKFIGDCIMAYFPGSKAAGALAAAIDILSLIKKMRKLSNIPFAKLLHVGIGLAEGPVIMGNVGSVLKKDFTAMGDAVNVAARLESSTREVQRNLVFDGNLCSSLRKSAGAHHDFESLGEINVKGRNAAVDLWSVKDPAVSKYVSKVELEDMISNVTRGKGRTEMFSNVSEHDLQKLERGENLALDLKELEDMHNSWRSLELQRSLKSFEFDIKTI